MACKHSAGHVFSLINFKLSQSDVLDKMSVKFETGSCGVKSRSLGQIIASCVVRYQQFPLKAYSSYTLGRLTRNLVGSFEMKKKNSLSLSDQKSEMAVMAAILKIYFFASSPESKGQLT